MEKKSDGTENPSKNCSTSIEELAQNKHYGKII